jgi:hypothetical protein
LLAIDPGKNDLIFCVDKDNKDATKFRYSQDQRRKETKKKKYSKIQLELKQEKIQGKTIIEWETDLSKQNRETLTIHKFQEYIREKSKINAILFPFYEKYIFRKLRLQSYRNTKRSEQRMLNKFQRLFGNKEEVVVCLEITNNENKCDTKNHPKEKE